MFLFVCYLEWLVVFFRVTRLVNVLLVRGKSMGQVSNTPTPPPLPRIFGEDDFWIAQYVSL